MFSHSSDERKWWNDEMNKKYVDPRVQSMIQGLIQFKTGKKNKRQAKKLINYLYDTFYVNHYVLEMYHYHDGDFGYSDQLKSFFTKICSTLFPTHTCLEQIKNFVGTQKVLEIEAGNGFFSYLLQSKGVNIHPTSIQAKNCVSDWTVLEKLSPSQALEKYHSVSILLLSWVNFHQELMDQIIKSNIQKLIITGEWDNPLFSEHFQYVQEIYIPVWKEKRDSIRLYQRI